jgi:hypothetical protein
MENNTPKFSPKDIPAYAGLALAAFGLYQIGKLAIDWVGAIEDERLRKKYEKRK